MSDPALSLDEQLKQLEIEKLRAEIAQSKAPQRFFERNWQGLVTAFAAVLAASGGLAALVTAASQTFDLLNHAGQMREELTHEQKVNAADKAAIDADRRSIEAERQYTDANKKLGDAASQLAAAKSQLDEVEVQIHRERTTFYPALVEQFEKERADERDREHAQIAVLQQQIAAILPRNSAAQAQATKLALSFKTSSAPAARRGLVYMQYADPSGLAAMQGLQKELTSDGYSAPGIEKVSPGLLNPAQSDEVRYFRPADKQRALEVAALANNFLNKACPKHGAIRPELHYVASSTANAPLELWTGSGCPPL
ncbi:MAG TPA: hypothetical protein VGG48_09910 [Rhizomicrobium sp.]|jgi:hypothetical protein